MYTMQMLPTWHLNGPTAIPGVCQARPMPVRHIYLWRSSPDLIVGSVPLTLPADFNMELNGKQDGMPANLQRDSRWKGIEQRDGMPANFLQLVLCFCILLDP